MDAPETITFFDLPSPLSTREVVGEEALEAALKVCEERFGPGPRTTARTFVDRQVEARRTVRAAAIATPAKPANDDIDTRLSRLLLSTSCCSRAVEHPCVCIEHTVCPVHGERHRGTHD